MSAAPLWICSTRWLSSATVVELDAAEVRLAGLPVVRVGQQRQIAVRGEAVEHERPGPDRLGEERLLTAPAEVRRMIAFANTEMSDRNGAHGSASVITTRLVPLALTDLIAESRKPSGPSTLAARA